MIALKLLLVLCSIHPLVNGENFYELSFHRLEKPEIQVLDEIFESWIIQPVDHFNDHDNRVWLMRYCENSAALINNGPIMIFIGGETNMTTEYLTGGLMYDLAAMYGGMMYYIEHRYYGMSHPTENISFENLQYLNADQALADLAYFIATKKEEMHLEKSPVIVFGCSYAGNLAAWARLKYPHLVQGALASSAPVQAKADFCEFYQIVNKSLSRNSEECVTNVKSAFRLMEDILKLESGPKLLQILFHLCDVPDVSFPDDISFLMNTIAQMVSDVAVHNRVVNGQTRIDSLCSIMAASELGNPLHRLAHLVSLSNPKGCVGINYRNFITTFRNVTWNPMTDSSVRQWFYQSCMQFGYFTTMVSDKSIFGNLVHLPFFIKICKDLYGDYYNEQLLNSRIERTNLMYGGQRLDVTNVIFTNGDIDPWHVLSVLEDINDSSPAILIKGSSHCCDLHSSKPTDGRDLKKARAKIQAIIGEWLST